MNFSEFRRLLGADPWNREPETLRARGSAPEFEQAAVEAETFERKLQRAVEIGVDEAVLDDILDIPNRPVTRRFPRWLAMAASVVMVAGVAGIVWMQSAQPESIEDYVAQHHAYDGVKVMGSADEPFDTGEIAKILASFDMAAGNELAGRIRFVKYCPTMDGRGAHMVVSTDQGPVQLIFMPETAVAEVRDFRFGQMQAHLVGLDRGSVAVIGRPDQRLAALDTLLRESLVPLSADA